MVKQIKPVQSNRTVLRLLDESCMALSFHGHMTTNTDTYTDNTIISRPIPPGVSVPRTRRASLRSRPDPSCFRRGRARPELLAERDRRPVARSQPFILERIADIAFPGLDRPCSW